VSTEGVNDKVLAPSVANCTEPDVAGCMIGLCIIPGWRTRGSPELTVRRDANRGL